jgi:hypothetical protein
MRQPFFQRPTKTATRSQWQREPSTFYLYFALRCQRTNVLASSGPYGKIAKVGDPMSQKARPTTRPTRNFHTAVALSCTRSHMIERYKAKLVLLKRNIRPKFGHIRHFTATKFPQNVTNACLYLILPLGKCRYRAGDAFLSSQQPYFLKQPFSRSWQG